MLRHVLPSAIRRIRSKGVRGTLASANPRRIFHTIRHGRELVSLRKRLMLDLARIWCGQDESVTQARISALHKTLIHAAKHVPYYRNLFDRLGIRNPGPEDLFRLPLLDKPLVRKHQMELRLPNWQDHVYYRMNTGGSTGQPIEFIVDNIAGIALAEHQEFAFRLMGFRNGDRIANFSGISIADDLRRNNIYWTSDPHAVELPYGSMCYATHYMDSRTLPFYFKSLNEARFSFLLGYPAAVHALARYCMDAGCRFEMPLKAIQLTSEVVLDSQISDIEKAFQTRVYLQYGMSEAAIYGHTFDDSHEYLCSPLIGWVEILDSDGRHVAPGEEGEVVVTGFHNRLMPFLRYRTGDWAVYGGQRNGIVVLKKVLGRTQDYVVRPDGTRISLTGLVFGQHFKAFAHITRWQLFQEEPGKVNVRIIPTSEFGVQDQDEIVEKFKRLADVQASFDFVKAIPLTERGKHLFLVQRIA